MRRVLDRVGFYMFVFKRSSLITLRAVRRLLHRNDFPITPGGRNFHIPPRLVCVCLAAASRPFFPFVRVCIFNNRIKRDLEITALFVSLHSASVAIGETVAFLLYYHYHTGSVVLSKSPKSLTHPPSPTLYQEIAGTQFMLYVSTGWRGSKCSNNVFTASIQDFLPDLSALSPQATAAAARR